MGAEPTRISVETAPAAKNRCPMARRLNSEQLRGLDAAGPAPNTDLQDRIGRDSSRQRQSLGVTLLGLLMVQGGASGDQWIAQVDEIQTDVGSWPTVGEPEPHLSPDLDVPVFVRSTGGDHDFSDGPALEGDIAARWRLRRARRVVLDHPNGYRHRVTLRSGGGGVTPAPTRARTPSSGRHVVDLHHVRHHPAVGVEQQQPQPVVTEARAAPIRARQRRVSSQTVSMVGLSCGGRRAGMSVMPHSVRRQPACSHRVGGYPQNLGITSEISVSRQDRRTPDAGRSNSG